MDPTAKTDQVPLLRKQLLVVLVPMLEGLEQVQEELELGLLRERQAAAVPAITVLITVAQAVVVAAEPVDHSMGLTLVQATAKVAECLHLGITHWDQLEEREAIARHLLDLRSYLLI